MFQLLKQNALKQNILIIKNKQKFIQDQIGQFNSLKINQPNLLSKKNQRSLSKQQIYPPGSDQSDSLSDYQLYDDEQFQAIQKQNTIIQKGFFNQFNSSPSINKSSIRNKKIKSFTQNYLSPQNKLKELERIIILSDQKLKLAQEYKNRQLNQLSEKYDRKIREMQSHVEKLSLKNNEILSKQTRIKQLFTQNSNLKDLLSRYQQRYWGFECLENELTKITYQNRALKIENSKCKELVTERSKQQKYKINLQINNLSELKSQFQSQQGINLKQKGSNVMQEKFKQNIDELRKISKKSKEQQKSIFNLEKQIKELQKLRKYDQTNHQRLSQSYEKRIQQLQQNLSRIKIELRQSREQTNNIKRETQKRQKSLLETIHSFSKYFSNQSIEITQFVPTINKTKQSTNKNQSHKNTSKNNELHQYSPIKFNSFKEVSFVDNKSFDDQTQGFRYRPQQSINLQEQTQKFREQTRNFEQNQTKYILQRQKHKARSKQKQNYKYFTNDKQKTGIKLVKQMQKIEQIDPQKSDYVKIKKLQKKLELANKKIVQLLKEKVIKKQYDF